MRTIKEGKADIYLNRDVFYNPKMGTLRDISVCFLNATGTKNKRLLDATSATGIRAIRYAKECRIKKIVALDINKNAYDLCKKNVRLNKLKIDVRNTSIQEFSSTYKDRFEIIDLDPFGSPAPNIFDIMKLSWDGTMLMITATDTAVLCGAHEGACVKIYGSKPLHNELCKEVGLRILLNYTAKIASQFNFGIAPLLSVSDMHYMRIFVRLDFGATNAINSVKTTGLGTFCRKCYEFRFRKGLAPQIDSACRNCGSQLESFGPLWLGDLYDKKIVSKMAKKSSIEIIKTINEELDTPLFYSIPRITKLIGRNSVSHYRVLEGLKRHGKKATLTQFDNDGIKTDAGAKEVLDLVRTFH